MHTAIDALVQHICHRLSEPRLEEQAGRHIDAGLAR
jgi:hypothetical protein